MFFALKDMNISKMSSKVLAFMVKHTRNASSTPLKVCGQKCAVMQGNNNEMDN